jgi:general secretion pathway protein K
VLWTLVLISFIVAHLTGNGRTETRIAGNLVADAVAEAADDGAIFAAIFNLLDPNPEQRWPLDGPARELTIGSSRVIVQLQDEVQWVNPNSASPELLEALLRAIGSDTETARRLAASIGEWVGSAPAARQQDAQLADYRAAGLDYGPPGAPLETIDELGRVLGMTPTLLGAIRPHLTLFGPPEPNPLSADPVVAAALSRIAPLSQIAVSGNQTAQNPLIVRITASTLGPGNARLARLAVVRVGTPSAGGYSVLAWGSRLD